MLNDLELGPKSAKKTSAINKRLTDLVRMKTLKLRGAADDTDSEQSVDITASSIKTRLDTKWTSSDDYKNRIMFNHGTMLDFFDYSGVFVQSHHSLVELQNPKIHGYKLMREDQQIKEYKDTVPKGSRTCNLFQIAKVGTPNMIFPSTLDIQMKNF